jgi:predicted nucleic acid-binding protein
VRVFVDTGALFALFVPRDDDHQAALTWLQNNRYTLLTSDYVLDKLLTLLKVHEGNHLALKVSAYLRSTDEIKLVYLTNEIIQAGWDIFEKYKDKGWSFTDCTSKAFMEATHITHAFAFDHHFEQFGSIIRVP